MFRTGLQGAAALPWKLSYKHWRRHLAKLKTECNFSVLFKSWRHCYSPRGCILKFPILVRVSKAKSPQENLNDLKTSVTTFYPDCLIPCPFLNQQGAKLPHPGRILCWGWTHGHFFWYSKRSWMLLRMEPTRWPESQMNFYPYIIDTNERSPS